MTLLDKYLPSFQFVERHGCDLEADTATILDAVAAFRPEHDPLFRFCMGIRELPMRLMSSRSRPRQFGIEDFTLLERDGEALVYGLAGAFWTFDFGLHPLADGMAFQALHTPGIAKLVLGFWVERGADGRNHLSTETRVFCPDETTRRRFTPYWYLIRPVSGLIRRRILAYVKADAKRRIAQGSRPAVSR